ncbi:MAG: asparagine synthetase B family protein [Prochlorothrix sp.]
MRGLIGYWGLSSPEDLRENWPKLEAVLPPTGQWQHSNHLSATPQQQLYWGIWQTAAFSPVSPGLSPGYGIEQGLEPNFDGELQILGGLSAGGLSQPETWVALDRHQRLIWYRDPLGRVPLYWFRQNTTLWFSSRLQWLAPLISTKTIDLAGFYEYTCFSYVPTPHSPLNEIQAVRAGVGEQVDWQGEFAFVPRVRSRAVSLTTWRSQRPQLTDEAVAIQQVQQHLKSAIERQTIDLQEPVGIFLSGGLDSSIIAALLVQAGISVKAYSLDFGELETSELPYAESVAQHLGIPLQKVRATPDRIRSAIKATVQALDTPFGDGVTVPLYLLKQAAKDEVRIIFNGENGDQLFAGWTNKPLIAASVYSRALGNGTLGQSPPTTEADRLGDPFTQQYLKTFHRLYGYESQALGAKLQALGQDPALWLQEALDSDGDSLLDRLRRASLMLKGAQNIQPRATQLALSLGLAIRSPFCDPDLTQWSFSLDSRLMLRGNCEKYILKRAVEGWLPAEIVWREKRGMGVPLTLWCLQELWSDLGRWLNPADLRAGGLWQANLPAQVLQGRLGGIQGRRVGEILWLMVMWQQWQQQVLGVPAAPKAWDHPFWLPRRLWFGLQSRRS